jgi:hypothetical protein
MVYYNYKDDYNIHMNVADYWIRATTTQIGCLDYSNKDDYINIVIWRSNPIGSNNV